MKIIISIFIVRTVSSAQAVFEKHYQAANEVITKSQNTSAAMLHEALMHTLETYTEVKAKYVYCWAAQHTYSTKAMRCISQQTGWLAELQTARFLFRRSDHQGYHHTIILPPSAIVVPTLEKMKTVHLIKVPAGLIKFHLLTRGLFSEYPRLWQRQMFFSCIIAFCCGC